MKSLGWSDRLPELETVARHAHIETARLQSPWGAPSLIVGAAQNGKVDDKPSAAQIDKLTSEQFDKGYAKGREDAGVECAAKTELEQQRYSAALSVARHEWVTKEGTALADRIAERFDSIFSKLDAEVAAVFDTWLLQSLEVAAKEQIVEQITRIVDRHQKPQITIHARPDMANAIAERLLHHRLPALIEPSESLDVCIEFHETTLESRVSTIADEMTRHS